MIFRALISQKENLAYQREMRDSRQVAHFCRFCVNLVMLVLLVAWVPISHDSKVEYQLTQHLRSKLKPSFNEMKDINDFYVVHRRYMHDLFFPDLYDESLSTYDTTQKKSFAEVNRLGKLTGGEGTVETGEPEIFNVGQVCLTMHRAPLNDCI